MGAGMIIGKKQNPDDSDLLFWREFAEMLGDADLMETADMMLAVQGQSGEGSPISGATAAPENPAGDEFGWGDDDPEDEAGRGE